jgi:hypothetical protein
VRERAHKRTLPRKDKDLVGKVIDERGHLFNALCTAFFPIERRFSGTLPYTTINMITESLTVGLGALLRALAYKSLQ